jgi:hypothetical protein
MFAQVKNKLRGSFVSEAHPDFEKINSTTEQGRRVMAAVDAAKRNVGTSLEDVKKATGLVAPDGRVIAKHKIEVLFGPKRTTNGPNAVRIMCWMSGSKLHGGGDESMFFCKDGTVENGQGCWFPIPPDQVKNGIAFCTVCNKGINAEKLTVQKEGRVTTRELSNELVRIFRQLNSNADIYCKYNKDDIHYISMLRQRGSAVAERLFGLHIYPLGHIIKDTAAGADLGKRFYAFLTA